VRAALYFKFGGDRRAMPSRVEADVSKDDNVKFCNEILGDVSRSFAAVIRQLPRELALDVVSLHYSLTHSLTLRCFSHSHPLTLAFTLAHTIHQTQ
jgi:hypothetical protein